MKENMKNILMNIRSIFRNNHRIYWCRLFILSVMASYHFRWYINNMFSVGCRRAMLFYCERLRFQEASYKSRTFYFMPSSTTFGSCSQHMRMVLWQPLVNLTRSHPKLLLAQWTRSSYSKIYRITFSPMDHKWSYFYACFYKNSIKDRSYCSATFGRNISDEVKLSYADDMGVWFLGLNVCNFRRILLSIVAQLSRQKSEIFIMNWYGW